MTRIHSKEDVARGHETDNDLARLPAVARQLPIMDLHPAAVSVAGLRKAFA